MAPYTRCNYCHDAPERTATLSALSGATGYNYRVHEYTIKLSALRLHMHVIITELLSKKKKKKKKNQPKKISYFTFLSRFSSFITVQLLFKCRFVASQGGLPRKFADCVFLF